ncbi:MAG TPA: ATP-binding protein [Bryobacteraceae bacterium]|nr:ATP-binding protein [Bryobacteraceae bacterium]
MLPTSLAGALQSPYEPSFWTRIRKIEQRQWWLWASAIVITLLLTAGMASFSFLFDQSDPNYSVTLRDSVRGLVALVFLFNLYTIYQQIEIHRMRRQLSNQEQMFRLISENAEDLITVVDRFGNREYNSPGYARFGYSSEELQQGEVPNQIHPDDRSALIEARRATFETGTGPRVEYRFRRKDGEWRILESTRSPVRNSRGQIEKVVIVSRDITERKQTEELLRRRDEQLRQSQKMEAVGRLSGGIAHDFNNLLGVIIGYSESIEYRLTANDPLRKSAEEIRKAGERAASLTHQLLAFSRQQVLQAQILDLNLLVTDMGMMLKRLIGMHIELSTSLEPELALVKAEQSQIEQVIVNLAVNARDAMPDGGKLSIETSNLQVDEKLASSFTFLQPGSYVLLTVRDTGVGMDSETRRHIFEPFFTTKGPGKGTGLGLATVYGVVKQSGGGVTVESEPGKGSTFKIFLPRTQESAVETVPVETASQPSSGTGTILLVEDEEALLNLTAERLVECGYNVLPAHDGLHALEIARSFDGPIQLLLTDIMMPRMGGLALARNMAELRPGIRVLFMTGHAERESSYREAMRSGAESIQKPFTHEQLLRLVRKALNASQLQPQA